jgi:hypothetical protein
VGQLISERGGSDLSEIFIAQKGLFINAPLRDDNFDVQGAEEYVQGV